MRVSTFRDRLVAGLVQPLPEGEGSQPAPSSGIPLGVGARVLPRKPAGSDVKAKLKALAPGRAYPESALAAELGYSVETIRRHAQELGCFRWVDTTGRDDWQPCVLSPETAAR